MLGPCDDGVEDGGGAVDDRKLVVAGGQAAPLFEVAEAPLDDVAVAVVARVEGWWSAAAWAAPLAVSDLVGRFGDDCDDAAPPQMSSDRAGGVGLVPAQPVRARAWSAVRSGHS